MCMSPVHREVPKTNGHSLSVPTSITPELPTTPRLGRPLNLKYSGTSRYSLSCVWTRCWTSQRFVFFCLFSRSFHRRFAPCSSFTATANSCCTSMYEKTFPIRVVQSPTHSTSSGRAHSVRQRCTAQEVSCEDAATRAVIHWFVVVDSYFLFYFFTPNAFVQSVREEEKDVYRLLLTMVSGGQSSFVHNGSSHAIVRSHRDL